MKKSLIILIFSLFALNVNAQMSYSLTLNYLPYADFFNKEKDKFFSNSLTSKNSYIPRAEFKISKSRWGLSIYYSKATSDYHNLNYGEIQANEIVAINHRQLGLNLYYEVFNYEFININVFSGVNYNSNYSLYLKGWFNNPTWHEPVIEGLEDETLGFQTGTNVTANVWRGLFASTNLRYTINPFTKHDLFRHNLMWELGLGYKIQRQKK